MGRDRATTRVARRRSCDREGRAAERAGRHIRGTQPRGRSKSAEGPCQDDRPGRGVFVCAAVRAAPAHGAEPFGADQRRRCFASGAAGHGAGVAAVVGLIGGHRAAGDCDRAVGPEDTAAVGAGSRCLVGDHGDALQGGGAPTVEDAAATGVRSGRDITQDLAVGDVQRGTVPQATTGRVRAVGDVVENRAAGQGQGAGARRSPAERARPVASLPVRRVSFRVTDPLTMAIPPPAGVTRRPHDCRSWRSW